MFAIFANLDFGRKFPPANFSSTRMVQTYLTKLLGVSSAAPLFWRLHVASRKPHELGRGWAKSFIQRMGFVMRNATKTAKKLSPNSEELKESYDIFDGSGELGSDRRANGARQ